MFERRNLGQSHLSSLPRMNCRNRFRRRLCSISCGLTTNWIPLTSWSIAAVSADACVAHTVGARTATRTAIRAYTDALVAARPAAATVDAAWTCTPAVCQSNPVARDRCWLLGQQNMNPNMVVKGRSYGFGKSVPPQFPHELSQKTLHTMPQPDEQIGPGGPVVTKMGTIAPRELVSDGEEDSHGNGGGVIVRDTTGWLIPV